MKLSKCMDNKKTCLFLDSGVKKIVTKTGPGLHDNTTNRIDLKICDKLEACNCCTVKLDHAQKDRIQGAEDMYTEVGECENWIMRESFIVTLKSNGIDGWGVKWVKIETTDGQSFICTFNAFVTKIADPAVTCQKL